MLTQVGLRSIAHVGVDAGRPACRAMAEPHQSAAPGLKPAGHRIPCADALLRNGDEARPRGGERPARGRDVSGDGHAIIASDDGDVHVLVARGRALPVDGPLRNVRLGGARERRLGALAERASLRRRGRRALTAFGCFIAENAAAASANAPASSAASPTCCNVCSCRAFLPTRTASVKRPALA